MTHRIDLRSDTVTQPTDAMRAAMAAAPVGDDQYGEDPSTNLLQARCAELLGKEAAFWSRSKTRTTAPAASWCRRPRFCASAPRPASWDWRPSWTAHACGTPAPLAACLAAAALHALDHHRARLPEDHANARVFAGRLAAGAAVELELATVQTNIVVFHLPATFAIDAPALSAQARERDVLVNAFGSRTVRAVTHLDVTQAQCERAADVLVALLAG